MYPDEGVAGLHMVALLHIELGHAAGELAGDAYLRGVALALHGVGALADCEEAENGEPGYHQGDGYDGGNEHAVFRADGHRIVILHSLCGVVGLRRARCSGVHIAVVFYVVYDFFHFSRRARRAPSIGRPRRGGCRSRRRSSRSVPVSRRSVRGARRPT